MATVLIIGTLDTKGPETDYLAQRIRDFGCNTLILDSGILGEADRITPDITRQQVAIAAGSTIDALRNAGSRGKAVEEMLKGVRHLALELHAQKKIHGVIALGGAEGSVLATAAMKVLPLGVPKIIVSPIASGRRIFEPFIGTRDIFVMHSVVDILGLNTIARQVFDTAAAGIAGMARAYEVRKPPASTEGHKQIAATMLGNTTKALMWIKPRFESHGYDLVIFHANGVGGPAMEEQIESGLLHGVIDYTLCELIGGIGGGHLRSELTRLRMAGAKGLPQVVVPGCVDFLGFGPKHEIPERYRDRPSHYHNPEFTLVRASRAEQLECARVIAKNLNSSRAPVSVLVPMRGLSIANNPQGEFWDSETDRLFRAELRGGLSKEIEYREIDAHINDEAFAAVVLEKALQLFK